MVKETLPILENRCEWATKLSLIITFQQLINSIKLETMTDFYVEMSSRTGCFANSYFSHTIKEWNNLSLEI